MFLLKRDNYVYFNKVILCCSNVKLVYCTDSILNKHEKYIVRTIKFCDISLFLFCLGGSSMLPYIEMMSPNFFPFQFSLYL